MAYRTLGKKIVNVIDEGTPHEESFDVAECDQPEEAIKLFDRAHYLNDVKRRYTESARTFARAEALPGFRWLNAGAS